MFQKIVKAVTTTTGASTSANEQIMQIRSINLSEHAYNIMCSKAFLQATQTSAY